MTGEAVGFTGTRRGLSEPQKQALQDLIVRLTPVEVHHGDCVGGDAEFHDLIVNHTFDIRIVIHPPKSSTLRAHKQGHVIQAPLDYISRNHNIVDSSAVLIAAPFEMQEQLRSGSWATIRYAKKTKKTVYMVLPDGAVQVFTGGIVEKDTQR